MQCVSEPGNPLYQMCTYYNILVYGLDVIYLSGASLSLSLSLQRTSVHTLSPHSKILLYLSMRLANSLVVCWNVVVYRGTF